jgi:translation initiation factor IF-3
MWSILAKTNMGRLATGSNVKWGRFLSAPKAKIMINDAIKFPEVRLVMKDPDTNRNTSKIMLRADALNTAKRHNLDLVLVDKDASPPVCKLEDVIKMLRKDKDMEKKKKSAQKARVMKEILIKIGIDPHDLDIKMKRSRKFLMDGHPLKVIIFARRKAMYKTKRHVEKNAHLLNLPMMDIDEICSAVFSSLMDLPITVAKKDILTAEAQDNARDKANAAAGLGRSTSSGDDDDDEDDDDFNIDDYDDDVRPVVKQSRPEPEPEPEPPLPRGMMGLDDDDESVSSLSDLETGPPEKVHVPEIIDGHIRRELVFVPKLTVIERMKYEKIRKEKEAAKRE